ncbi:MAG: hypothetical protein ACPGO3_01500 [Magnetospiraceae bacterium]
MTEDLEAPRQSGRRGFTTDLLLVGAGFAVLIVAFTSILTEETGHGTTPNQAVLAQDVTLPGYGDLSPDQLGRIDTAAGGDK